MMRLYIATGVMVFAMILSFLADQSTTMSEANRSGWGITSGVAAIIWGIVLYQSAR